MKYRKKPLVVEAERFDPDNKPWPSGVYERHVIYFGSPTVEWAIDTLEGRHEVSRGDWIITGIKGEKYPCKPDIFEATYEPIHDHS